MAAVFRPVAVLLEHLAPQRYLLIFVGSGLAIPPPASSMIVALAFFFVPATLPH